MATGMHPPLSYLYSVLVTTAITILPWLVQSATLESDIEALRSLKAAIDPYSILESSFLDTWNFQVDPCDSPGAHFLGVLCTDPDPDNSTTSRVSVIHLDAGGYDGFLTPSIGNLTELTLLDLSKNMFRGQIPTTISNLRKLQRLVISENFFTGNLPPRMERLKRLEILDVSNNVLSGSIPGTISGLTTLTFLRLSNNRFSGRIPHLTGLWQLNTLDLSSNHLHGHLPDLPVNLRTLLLSHNTLSSNVQSLTRLRNLETIDLSDNNFSGSINEGIITLPSVNRINVSVNSFSRMEVIQISSQGTQLKVLDVHRNSLRGGLPVNLVTYGNLTDINLSHNQFSGRIPQEYGEKLGIGWRSLFLENNFLEGSLPPQFNNSRIRVKGSLAQNCLNCPARIELCHGGQRLASQCIRRREGSTSD